MNRSKPPGLWGKVRPVEMSENDEDLSGRVAAQPTEPEAGYTARLEEIDERFLRAHG